MSTLFEIVCLMGTGSNLSFIIVLASIILCSIYKHDFAPILS